ncbi:MAG: glycoside hydrolase [Anaerolineae bacterium]|nr:glycoside hydrolase [Anaerolineae bacterium]
MTKTLYQVLTDLANVLNVLDHAGDHNGIQPIAIGVMNTATPPEMATIQGRPGHYTVVEGLHNAYLMLYADTEHLRELVSMLEGTPPPIDNVQRVQHVLEQITVVPAGFRLKVVKLLVGALGVDLDIKLFDPKGVIPFPLRYPSGENTFRTRCYTPTPLPGYDPGALPALVVDDHPEWVAVYDKAWALAFGNLRQPEPESGFVANFIDTAFNDNSFMWDSCFMALFGYYGRRVFPFIQTLDNFYARQHADGFICREINTYDGRDIFAPHNPNSTGPNIMAWTEWLNFERSQDVERLRVIFPPLVAYHRWLRDWHTWPDGSYFTTGWGSGMDNQTRVPDSILHHRHYTWTDANFQQALNCRMLQQIGNVIGRDEFNAELQAEFEHLEHIINTRLWNERERFYMDLAPDGSHSTVKSIGAYWGLLSDVVPPERAAHLIAHLDDPAFFNRPHRVPSQAADSDGYQPDGAYWRGGVWPPTNYMILRGLARHGQDALAYAIGRNHLKNVAQVFEDTGTLWEDYAPEYAGRGNPAKPDFVGWTGVSAIMIPIEYVIGLRPDLAHNTLTWTIRLTEQHGVQRYPFGANGTLDLICAPRPHDDSPPSLTVTTNIDFSLTVRWREQTSTWQLEPGTHQLQL